MKWTIDPEVRDQFGMGVHRDILIVPHATKVTPVAGKPPEITNKRPVFEYVKNSQYPDGMWVPKYENGQLVYEDVDWIIDNSVLIKEKFQYSHTLNSDDNLTFSGANAAMVRFSIRNEKEYVEEIDYETQQPTGNYYWEQTIPNLQYYQFVRKTQDGSERVIEGELSGAYIIEVYTYINGDSSTLMYLGMYAVEEDKITGNGYERQITAYDFMATFRDMDIFYWYKHLFTGINIADDDYLDFTGEAKKKEDPEDPDAETNWIRKPADELFPEGEHWTIGAALKDLMENLAAYDMIVWEEDEKTHKKVAKNGMTVSNPSEYKRDYDEGTSYSGFGMPIVLDPDLFEVNGVKKEPYIPTEWGEEEYECYGYMDIMDMPFMENPDIMKKESLSMGKLLEDIGRLAGRYPIIRTDKLDDHDYIDPNTVQPTETDPHPNKYNNYERCILTFKPLPSSKDDDKVKNVSEMILTNHEIVKGFEHASYKVDDVEIIKIGIKDEDEITYKRLNKTLRNQVKKGAPVQTFTFSDNIFASYLVTKSDKDEIKANLEEYAKLREKLFGTQAKNGNMSSKALFYQGYMNMRYRSYTPFKLTTYGDPCRDVGDRIQVVYEDKITGEKGSFYTYILERSLDGIQKMMDTYQASGDIYNPIFSNYQTGSKYQGGSSFSQQASGYNAFGGSNELNIAGMTPNDLVEYWRNFGIRLLDEPTKCSAKFMKSSEKTVDGTLYATSSYPDETYIKDGDTTNPITVGGESIDVKEGDYVKVKNYQNDDPAVPTSSAGWWNITYVLYVYTANNEWKYAGGSDDPNDFSYGKNIYNMSAYGLQEPDVDVFLDHVDNYPVVCYDGYATWSDILSDEVQGSTYNTLVLVPKEPENKIPYKDSDNNLYRRYGNISQEYADGYLTETTTKEVEFGDTANILTIAKFIDNTSAYDPYAIYTYQYPGVWIRNSYPKLDEPIEAGVKKYVALKWKDPADITDWEPRPCSWEGTVIVRKENGPPMHRWDGTKIVRTTTRDKYKSKAYKDEDIEANKVYYYGFFPYYTKISDPNHPILFYTFTKYLRVETGVINYAPVIDSITVDGIDATITYTIITPVDTVYKTITLYGKKGDNPTCDNTDDIVIELDENETSQLVQNLVDNSVYYFCIVTTDINDARTSSTVESCTTGESRGNLLYKSTDVVPIKRTYNGDAVMLSIADISAYGVSQGYGGNFALIDAGNTRDGLGIRYINIGGDTIHLADSEYLGKYNNIGYSCNGTGSYTNKTTLFGSNATGDIQPFSVAVNTAEVTIQNIKYLYLGDNVSGNVAIQGFYIADDNFTNIYEHFPVNPTYKGRYTTDPTEIIRINRYPGYTDLTCAEILQALKNTDSTNSEVVGFFATPTNDGSGGHEIQPFGYKSGGNIHIKNYLPRFTYQLGDTDYVYVYVEDGVTCSAANKQYNIPVTSGGVITFSGSRPAYMSTISYEGVQYIGKGTNGTDPATYSDVVFYFDPTTFGNIIT